MVDPDMLDAELRSCAREFVACIQRFAALIDTARAYDVHPGHPTWISYIVDVVKSEMPQLALPYRRRLVEVLAMQGLSQHVIAQAVGVDQSTVSRDMRRVMHGASPERVTGLDGKQYSAICDPKRDELSVGYGESATTPRGERWRRKCDDDKRRDWLEDIHHLVNKCYTKTLRWSDTWSYATQPNELAQIDCIRKQIKEMDDLLDGMSSGYETC